VLDSVARLLFVLVLGPGAYGQVTEWVSVDSSGQAGDDRSDLPSLSSGGRWVAFRSQATNLVANDTNNVPDIFVRDRKTSVTSRVSVATSGAEADKDCSGARLSADGQCVVFWSAASTLVVGDTNNTMDVFHHDRRTGVTLRVSEDAAGTQADGESNDCDVSGDGRLVAFSSAATNLVPGDTNGAMDVFVKDITTGFVERVSVDSHGDEADRGSWDVGLSADGRWVVFTSAATNLVRSDPNGWVWDIFVHDRQTGLTEMVSLDSSGGWANDYSHYSAISDDGRFVAFASRASNLVPGDTNTVDDIFLRDRLTALTTRISVSSLGAEANASSVHPELNADGSRVTFQSGASNLVPNDSNGDDAFVHEPATGTTWRASVDSFGHEADGGSRIPDISADGRYVGFGSDANNLAPADVKYKDDVFVHGPLLTLEVDKPTATAGDLVQFVAWKAAPGTPNGFLLVEVDGTPLVRLLSSGIFAADGTWSGSFVVPPGLAGVNFTFQDACPYWGRAERSNRTTLQIQ